MQSGGNPFGGFGGGNQAGYGNMYQPFGNQNTAYNQPSYSQRFQQLNPGVNPAILQ